MVSHYYELTGRSKQIVEGLEKLYYVREGIDPVRVNNIKQVAKKILSFLLLIPVLPLTLLAHVIRVVTRERIPTETFEQERAKWENIYCQGNYGNYRRIIIEKLITSRMSPDKYGKFLALDFDRDRKGGGYFCGLDGLCIPNGEELARALQDNKKILICISTDRSSSKAFQESFPNYSKLKEHIADNLLVSPYVADSPHQLHFPEWIDQGLDVLFLDHLRPIDFTQQASLAASQSLHLARTSYGH